MKVPVKTIRIFSCILATAMVVGVTPLPATTACGEMKECRGQLSITFTEQPLYGNIGQNNSVLSGTTNKAVYNYLKQQFAQIAEHGGSTVITIPTSVFGEIVVTGPVADPNAAISAAVNEAINLRKILDCLLVDCPYELYWYDKIAGSQMAYGGYQLGDKIVINSLEFRFQVSNDYRASGYNSEAPAVTSNLSAVTLAIANAKSVIAANSGKTDRQKLNAYKQYICDAVSYNTVAAGGGASYGNPWQLIYVFDGNPATNVVCEGYAKAFQYLCDHTTFSGNVSCYTMTGQMATDGSGEGHMWNVVVMDDGCYMVDVTNSDTGSIGQGGELFMNAAPTTGNALGNTFKISTETVRFTYDLTTVGLYSEAIRMLGVKSSGYKATIENSTKGTTLATIKVNGMAVSGSTTLAPGDTFTATCNQPCAVGYSTDGGATYNILNAVATGGTGEYRFTLPSSITADFKLGVALRGDANGDGRITMADITRMSRYIANKGGTNVFATNCEITGISLLAADANKASGIAMTDITRLSRYIANANGTIFTTNCQLSW